MEKMVLIVGVSALNPKSKETAADGRSWTRQAFEAEIKHTLSQERFERIMCV